VNHLQLVWLFSNERVVSAKQTYELINPQGQFPLILTCEHASYSLPSEYQGLGVLDSNVQRHIGWDIGARAVVAKLAQALDAPAVCSGYSRLLIDCNRAQSDYDLIVEQSDRIVIPGNHNLTDEERQRRISHFYNPYHEAVDALVKSHTGQPLTLLSVHSFTPVLGKKERRFDLGVLFDAYDDLAHAVGQRLHHEGHRIRYNEPYSGYDGLIFSARNHGEKNGIVYLELEINQNLITTTEGVARIGTALSNVCRALFSVQSHDDKQ
jgi:predicted N-formylglutamate amidohydrolase